MALTGSEKVREDRLRRMARRQGMTLHRKRSKDPRALGHGRYWLKDIVTGRIVIGMHGSGQYPIATLDEIEAHLLRPWP